MITRRTIVLSTLALCAAAGLLVAGPLSPPAGPVASTYKTLSEVEPRIAINYVNTPGDNDSIYKITQPGSYYLTGNVQGALNVHGIEIAASNVTVDLMGFMLTGFGSLNGVSVTVAGATSIAVVNGTVRSFGGCGINLYSAYNCRVEGVLASGNGNFGIRTGTGGTVSNCSAYNNAAGINTDSGSTVSNCAAKSNTSFGINTSGGGTVLNCSADQNGYYGVYVNIGSTVSNCSAWGNGDAGIGSADGCTISNCSALSNDGGGIETLYGCTISNCTATMNPGIGISAGSDSTVADCTASNNSLDGIACVSSCLIRGNHCYFSGNGGGGAGIHATGNDNRIEGNNCTGANRGIEVGGAGNIIFRNTCATNSIDWVFAANNVFGPIIDRRVPASAAVSGFSAAGSLGSTDPNANFSY